MIVVVDYDKNKKITRADFVMITSDENLKVEDVKNAYNKKRYYPIVLDMKQKTYLGMRNFDKAISEGKDPTERKKRLLKKLMELSDVDFYGKKGRLKLTR